MKKMFLLLVVAMIAATATFAQSTLVATLSHGEDISMFYGVYAYRDAMNAAVSGDVINLSGGGFQGVSITKAVIVRGTGIDDTNPTYINGNFTINIPTADANRLSMEGIYCSGTITMDGTFENAQFVKCKFSQIQYSQSASIKNTMYANCKIATGYSDSFILKGTSTVQFINCFIDKFKSNDSETSANAVFVNSILTLDRYYYSDFFVRSQLFNCILYGVGSNVNSNRLLSTTTLATNCVAVAWNGLNIFKSSQANIGCVSVSTEIFKTFQGTYTDKQTFELTDEAMITYLGTDGTEVGIYGGMMPYSSIPSYPQITKMNVANKTTADGKLSVDIEVSAVE